MSSANHAISSIYHQNNDIKNAIKYQLASIKNSKTEKDGAFSSIKLAELYIKDGSFKNSSNILDEIKNNFSDDLDVMNKVEYVSGLLMNK